MLDVAMANKLLKYSHKYSITNECKGKFKKSKIKALKKNV